MLDIFYISLTALWVVVGILFLIGVWVTYQLPKSIHPQDNLPKISIVIASQNEERDIEGCVRSLLSQLYPNLQLIVVNDRSTDRTGDILNHLSKEFPILQVIHIDHLPNGWLGKNHALWVGAKKATGNFILFCDADIHFQPTTLISILDIVTSNKKTFAAVFPQFIANGFWNRGFIINFAILLSIRIRFWEVPFSWSSAYCGIGACNLIERHLYESFGGHEALKMEIADDMVLAKLAKKNGGKPCMIAGRQHVQVEWQKGGLVATMKGLEKNAFAGFKYSWWLLISQSSFLLLLSIWPFISFLISPLLGIFSFSALLLIYTSYSVIFSLDAWKHSLFFPLNTLLLIGTSFYSAITMTLKKGIRWRNSVYDLNEIKKHAQF